MSYRLVFFAFFVKAKFSETEVICDIDSIKIKAANFDYLNGLKIILGDQYQTSGDEGFITNCVADDNRSILLPEKSGNISEIHNPREFTLTITENFMLVMNILVSNIDVTVELCGC